MYVLVPVPYLIMLCFFIRSLLLDGAKLGLGYLVVGKVSYIFLTPCRALEDTYYLFLSVLSPLSPSVSPPPPFLLRFFSPLTSPFILVFSLSDIGHVQRECVVPSRAPSLVFLGSWLWLHCVLSFAHEPVQQLSQ